MSFLIVTAGLQMLWALAILYFSTRPPAFAAHIISPHFDPGIVYSIYSGVHALYVIIGASFSVLLRSRGWIRASAFASAVPGPGVLFGLLQVVPAILIFRKVQGPQWDSFFKWLMREDSSGG
ncbi:MAG: hypothetical protein JNM27_02270 [Leptospirales bacterium]|nr:hypothetical protein [Leptospirales bacterium]